MKVALTGLLLAFPLAALFAQRGDRSGETQRRVVPREKIPPSPVLAPETALRSFRVAPGFRVELVASEPLVHDPVAIAFDSGGRLWAVEMRGYMPNIEGRGEEQPVGQIVTLDDTDNDGRMDRRTVFLDGLVLPRALALARDGVLVAEPPYLWFCRDTDGDGKCDEKIGLASDYGRPGNPEHTANGLRYAIDNWIYSANHMGRYRFRGTNWVREPTIFRGQWGISQDDFGRLFYNSNADPLRADLVPAQYLRRNPNFPQPSGLNVQVASDPTVWPARVNPGVNRGYQPGHLRPDGSLARFTAACAPWIYRGDAYPAEFRGNAFVCEPAGNLVRRNVLEESGLSLTATNPYGRAEFLASTDERFRPVNLETGPDGALYIVDFYRGILQHRLYVTSYLRQQIEERGLDRPTGLGRIYRVVRESSTPERVRPRFSNETPARWVGYLEHPNGWWRDTAQRLLIERGDLRVVPQLKQLVRVCANPLGRLHALWTLEGLGQLDWPTVQAVFDDPHPQLRSAAIRLSETFLEAPDKSAVLDRWRQKLDDPHPTVQWQLMLSLGEIKGPEPEQAMLRLLERTGAHRYLRDAALSGLRGRELEFLERLSGNSDWQTETQDRAEFIVRLTQCIWKEENPNRISRLLDWLAARQTQSLWQAVAVLDGLTRPAAPARRSRAAPAIKTVRLESEPKALPALIHSTRPEIRSRSEKLAALLLWPGKVAGGQTEAQVKPLTPEQQKRFEAGKELYLVTCGACHQPNGLGQEGLAPPLADTDWTIGSEQRLVRMVLQGVRGPIQVKGQAYSMEMPMLYILEDDQIAAVLTYVRREWGHTAPPIEPETVARIRQETADRLEAWTEEELLRIP